MAHDPSRYTVMDTRSLASLRALGRLHPGPVGATKDEWDSYLAACREASHVTGESLRRLDRALIPGSR